MPNRITDMLAEPTLLERAKLLRPDVDAAELIARTILSMIAEPGDETAGRLTTHIGAADTLRAVFETSASNSASVTAQQLAEARMRWDRPLSTRMVHDVLSQASDLNVRLIVPSDANWPTSLSDLGTRAPMMLWARGDLSALTADSHVTITGARAATSYGEHQARQIAGDLAYAGVVVISGGAYGIDGAAHRGAIEAGGKTIAVLASGVDRSYPVGHANLFERIRSSGLLLSELPIGAAPTKYRFLMRNRLVAALSGAVVVVEAGWRSGSLTTAGNARSLDRPLGVVPGPVTSAASAGCHRLLQEYNAACVTNAADVRALLGSSQDRHKPSTKALHALNDTLTAILHEDLGWTAQTDFDFDALNDLVHHVAGMIMAFNPAEPATVRSTGDDH